MRAYRSTTMPWLSVRHGERAPHHSLLNNTLLTVGTLTETEDVLPSDWFDDKSTRLALGLTEQILIQREGFAMQLLHAELREHDEQEELGERWRPRF